MANWLLALSTIAILVIGIPAGIYFWMGESETPAPDDGTLTVRDVEEKEPGPIRTLRAGTVEGTVVYRSDPERPWRFRRYYVRNRKTGELAEAVVALQGVSSDNPGSRVPVTVTIDQKDHSFVPETVAIHAGDSVRFTNSDPDLHNVHSPSGTSSFNAAMKGREEFLKTFRRPGGVLEPVRVGCNIHPAMRAWIFVFGHPRFCLTSGDGRFRLGDVPPGTYRLEMRHPAGGLHFSGNVEVREGETTEMEIAVSPDDRAKPRG